MDFYILNSNSRCSSGNNVELISIYTQCKIPSAARLVISSTYFTWICWNWVEIRPAIWIIHHQKKCTHKRMFLGIFSSIYFISATYSASGEKNLRVNFSHDPSLGMLSLYAQQHKFPILTLPSCVLKIHTHAHSVHFRLHAQCDCMPSTCSALYFVQKLLLALYIHTNLMRE